ncbi:MAG TPA: FecR domain-containing protein [Steroidobacteraceae bacterium]|nr:FecR domain-containing protein [Steroidobacteraceae bacterium]
MTNETITTKILKTLKTEDAAAMFVARNSKGLTAEEEQLLAGWLETDVAHRKEYENAERVWQTFVNIRGDEIASAMHAHAAAERKKKRRSRWRYAIAGVVVAVAAIATFIFTPALNSWKGDAQTKGSLAVTVVPYTTLRGEIREEQWPDGSHIHLDAETIVVGRFGPAGRQVQLQRGRALFSVAADRVRPFYVLAGGRSIVAVGTKFEVNFVNDGLSVTLLEGHLVVEGKKPGDPPILLEAGQRYRDYLGETSVRNLADAGEKLLSWRTGAITLDDEPLFVATQIMNRYSEQQFVIKDPIVAFQRISGDFRRDDPQGFAAKLAELPQLTVTQAGNRVELTRVASPAAEGQQ